MFPVPAALRGLGVALLALASFAPTAAARNAGIFGRSGKDGTTCTFCHVNAGAATASLDVVPTNAAHPGIGAGYVPFADYLVTVTVSGGPGAEFGFNFAADQGAGTLLDPVRTRQYFSTPEFTHTISGTRSPTFQFLWTAPAAGAATMWLAVNSANDDDTRFNDAIGTLVLSASPVPPEMWARLGSAVDGAGLPATTFLVNGSRGDDRRFVATNVVSRFSLAIVSDYVGAPDPMIHYAIYAVRHANRANEITPLPGDMGTFCFPIPIVGGSSDVLAQTIGDTATYGVPRFAAAPLGPGEVVAVPRVPPSLRGRRITFQPLLESVATGSGFVVGNAVVVEFAP